MPASRSLAPGRIAIALAALLSTEIGAGAARGASRNYNNDSVGITSFDVPRGWAIAPPSGYPQILLTATTPVGTSDVARLLLGAQRTVSGSTAVGLAADTRVVLLAQGFSDVRIAPMAPGINGDDRARLDAVAAGARLTIRQVYAVQRESAVVITLMVPSTKDAHGRNFETELLSAADSLELATPTTSAPGALPPSGPPKTAPPATPGAPGPATTQPSRTAVTPPAPMPGSPSAAANLPPTRVIPDATIGGGANSPGPGPHVAPPL